jgi:hypothetical protein
MQGDAGLQGVPIITFYREYFFYELKYLRPCNPAYPA